MKSVLTILGYFIGTIVLGALLAPLLYHGLHRLEPWALANGLLRFDPIGNQVAVRGVLAPVITAPFLKVFDRAMLVAAVLLLWPAIRALRIRGMADLHLHPDPRRGQHLVFGFLVAGGVVAAMGGAYLFLGYYHLKVPAPWGEIPRLALTATVVGMLEEALFRGAILGLFLRTLKPGAALFWTTLVFAALHYLKPVDQVELTQVNWLSGFAVLPGVFHQFSEPQMLLADFLTLFTLGWILGYVRLRTGALWMSIGVHAGVVLVKMSFSKLTKRDGEFLPWIGPELQIGIVPVALLLLAFLFSGIGFSMKSFWELRGAAAEGLRILVETAGGLLYPPHCAVCGVDTPRREPLCATCRALLPRLREPFCRCCSEPFFGALTGTFICHHCRDRQLPFACAVAAYRTGGAVSRLIHQFKYGGALFLRHQLAEWLEEGLADPRLQAPPPDFLVPVPLHPARQRERGFNQAAVLCEALSDRSGLPVRSPLRRVRYTGTQTALGRRARMENLQGAFRLRQAENVTGCHLLLIDDVFTTGSTAEECARVLLQAGAASVRVLTVARAYSPF